MVKSKINNGFVYVTNYSCKFKELIQSIVEKAEKIIPSGKMKDMGIFLFGSPSRQEMVDESDADIMIIRKEDSEDYKSFRAEFMNYLEKENFSKIDVPDWGTFEDCEQYLKNSVTEGNQVVEAKFIYGDPTTINFLENLKDTYCTTERFEKVFCFQKLYFDQYYKQRTITGIKNVKYGHGGTRDFMFVTWFVNILDALDNRKINIEDNFPMIYKSLSSLYERKIIDLVDYKNYLESINIVLILRNEILIQNKWTEEEGLTSLNEKAIRTLFKRKIFKEEEITHQENLKQFLEKHIDNIIRLKKFVWEKFLEYLYKSKGEDWISLFNYLLSGNITLEKIEKIKEKDELSQMALIWNINKERDIQLFNNVFNKYKESESWEVLASICSHPQCPSETLDYIAMRFGCQKGYEYLLRIISRNKNVSKETLKKIIDNPCLEYRYKIVAKVAYDKGVEKANELR